MSQYMLSVHTGRAEDRSHTMTAEQRQSSMDRIAAVEADMKASNAFVFSARLHDSDASTVVRMGDGDLVMTDGPFIESKEHIGGFYIINAEDLDAALAWAGRVVEAINAPIEVRPFVATSDARA